jgi:hypothetical protein
MLYMDSSNATKNSSKEIYTACKVQLLYTQTALTYLYNLTEYSLHLKENAIMGIVSIKFSKV